MLSDFLNTTDITRIANEENAKANQRSGIIINVIKIKCTIIRAKEINLCLAEKAIVSKYTREITITIAATTATTSQLPIK